MIIKLGEIEWSNIKVRRYARPKDKECAHLHLEYTEHGEVLKCKDCNVQVSARWALEIFFGQLESERENLDLRAARVKADEERLLIHRAALAVQDAWRKRDLVPICPHCSQGIEPCDGFGKKGAVSRSHYKTAPLLFRAPLQVVEEEKGTA